MNIIRSGRFKFHFVCFDIRARASAHARRVFQVMGILILVCAVCDVRVQVKIESAILFGCKRLGRQELVC